MFIAALALILSMPNPYEIYDRARARWASAQYPRFLTYSVNVSADIPSATLMNTYSSFTDTTDGAIKVRATSPQEAAKPYTPRGLNFTVRLKVSYTRHPKISGAPSADGDDGDIHVSKAIRVSQQEQYDTLGVPLLSPTYSFGLRPPELLQQKNSAFATPTLKTIAAVTAVRPQYVVAYDGTTTLNGTACLKLRLKPLRDPALLRLRELWIDAQTFETVQVIVQGNFTSGPAPTIPWLIRFADKGSGSYIVSESALAPFPYRGRRYTNISITFDHIQPADVPGVTWNLSMFRTSGDVLTEPAI
ncbi:MAG: hypothetical protein ABR508_00490 [Candidatus Baltobacteraceae bacterium]